MMDLGRIRQLTKEHKTELPWWAEESLHEMADRIEELEHQLVGLMDVNQEMYGALTFYAHEPNGQRARQITED